MGGLLEKELVSIDFARAIEKLHIWSASKHKRLEKSQFVEDLGDVGYGVGWIKF